MSAEVVHLDWFYNFKRGSSEKRKTAHWVKNGEIYSLEDQGLMMNVLPIKENDVSCALVFFGAKDCDPDEWYTLPNEVVFQGEDLTELFGDEKIQQFGLVQIKTYGKDFKKRKQP